MVKDAATATSNWSSGMAAPTTRSKYIKGIQGVTQSPMAAAATPAAQQKYLNSVTQAVSSGRMAAALNAVSLSYWQTQATGPGANALSMGATKGQPKYQAFANKWASVWASASQAAAAIPSDGTVSTALQKISAVLVAFKQAAGKPTG